MIRGDKIMISLGERYENFKNTIQECGSYLLTESDDIIKYNLFEQFPVDAVSFLHENTLNILLDEGMIDHDILQKSIELRNSFLELEKNPDLFSIDSVKKLDIWKKVLEASDEIKELIYW